MTEPYVTRVMSAADVETAVAWAAAEGWNPGVRDADCFSVQDPNGFIGGYVGGRMVASISVVAYDPSFAFLGFYIVHPEWRGQGLGYALWQAGMTYAGARNVGLDGVVAEQENYKRSGFELAYRNIRFGGRVATRGKPDAAGLSILPATGATEEIVAFDRRLFPAPRTAFLTAWLAADGHIARIAVRDGDIVGLGVARPCRSGWKIGQLFAADLAVADAVLGALLSAIGNVVDAPEVELYLDVPEPNAQAIGLADGLGLTPGFETARMYTGPAPSLNLDHIFGVTSFELG
ncbi:MAG: GNAT family N-acetyltransferase [Alphaproteobacteria bacterium]|nr:GNAT family N-acetyltransferase [Alphaproteobacteria bacterium]